MAGSGTGIFALGGALLVLDFFAVLGWGGAPSGVHAVIEGVLLVAGLLLGGVGIWRVFHSHLPFHPRPGEEDAAHAHAGL